MTISFHEAMQKGKSRLDVFYSLIRNLLSAFFLWGVASVNPAMSADWIFFKGSSLLQECEKSSFVCSVYVIGVTDSSQIMDSLRRPNEEKYFCLPVGAEGSQLAAVTIKWLRDHPEQLHYPAATLVITSMAQAFPCN